MDEVDIAAFKLQDWHDKRERNRMITGYYLNPWNESPTDWQLDEEYILGKVENG